MSRAVDLPEIPLIDVGAVGAGALLAAEPARAQALLASAGRNYSRPAVRLGDAISRRWLDRHGNPYLAEIDAIAATLRAPGANFLPGAYFLNVSYEWGCTGGVTPAPGGGCRLVRVLDWPFDGLGINLVAARQTGPAGAWINLTWPGFVGCIQGLAPGRFAAALNQAPMARPTRLMPLDWAIGRGRVWRRGGLPPAHLLRRVFETCADYRAAKAMLCDTPLALPAIFLLAGPEAGQGCVIERQETRAAVFEQPASAANHWQTAGWSGRPRGGDSQGRRRILAARLAGAGPDLDWLAPPVLNATTRLALVAEPASGRLTARGFEATGPATAPLRLGPGSETRRAAPAIPGQATGKIPIKAQGKAAGKAQGKSGGKTLTGGAAPL
jgi:hypothetical protein